MSHILEKIQAMNQIDGGLEALQESLRSCGETGFSEEGRQTCRKQLAEIRENSRALKLEITSLLDSIDLLLAGESSAELYGRADAFVQKTRELFQRLYLMKLHSEESYSGECLENYYGTSYSKNALLIYIRHPFLFEDMTPEHTKQAAAGV